MAEQRRGRVREALFAALLGACLPPSAAAQSQQTQHALASCAAYFLNATQAHPMSEYERLFAAGELATNRLSGLVGRTMADRLIGDASLEIKRVMGDDWRNFGRVEGRYAVPCQGFLDASQAAPASAD
ncbi:MAG: hypothetical protein ACU85V_18225 [Gammaproteobacteria bacterium]